MILQTFMNGRCSLSNYPHSILSYNRCDKHVSEGLATPVVLWRGKKENLIIPKFKVMWVGQHQQAGWVVMEVVVVVGVLSFRSCAFVSTSCDSPDSYLTSLFRVSAVPAPSHKPFWFWLTVVFGIVLQTTRKRGRLSRGFYFLLPFRYHFTTTLQVGSALFASACTPYTLQENHLKKKHFFYNR